MLQNGLVLIKIFDLLFLISHILFIYFAEIYLEVGLTRRKRQEEGPKNCFHCVRYEERILVLLFVHPYFVIGTTIGELLLKLGFFTLICRGW